MNDQKLRGALSLLEAALDECDADLANPLRQAALAKAFESSFEYLWKCLKREANQAGMEAYSPRDALRAAAELRIIDDLELWLEFLNARNLSVHDYVGMDDASVMQVVHRFRDELGQLLD